jgi:hypothetical protein
VQPPADLAEGQVGGQQRQQPQLGGGQCRRPEQVGAHGVDPGVQLVGLPDERAQLSRSPEGGRDQCLAGVAPYASEQEPGGAAGGCRWSSKEKPVSTLSLPDDDFSARSGEA